MSNIFDKIQLMKQILANIGSTGSSEKHETRGDIIEGIIKVLKLKQTHEKLMRCLTHFIKSFKVSVHHSRKMGGCLDGH